MSNTQPPFSNQPNHPHASPTVPYGTPQVYVQPGPSNGLGVAGFVTSLIGLMSCGILSPIALLLSFLALFKRPRGFAVAGTIISVIGTIALVLVGASFVLAMIGVKKGAEALGAQLTTMSAATDAATLIEEHRKTNENYPTQEVGNQLISGKLDGWNTQLVYETGATGYQIRSAGPDTILNTQDDVTYDGVELKRFDFNTENPAEIPAELQQLEQEIKQFEQQLREQNKLPPAPAPAPSTAPAPAEPAPANPSPAEPSPAEPAPAAAPAPSEPQPTQPAPAPAPATNP